MSNSTLPAIRLIAAVSIAVHTMPVFANPNNRDPDAAIAVYGDAAKTLQTKAQAAWEEGKTAADTIMKQSQEGNAARLGPPLFIAALSNFTTARQLGERLRTMGETAGVDYVARVNSTVRPPYMVCQSWCATPNGQRYVEGVRAKLVKQTPARARELAKLESLASQQNWVAAEAALDNLFNTLNADLVFLPDPERPLITRPFDEVRTRIETAMIELRRKTAAEQLAARKASESPDLAGLIAQLNQAASDLGSSGSATFDGQMVSGPEFVERFTSRWHEVHAAMMRVQAMDWALRGVASQYGTASGNGDSSESPVSAEYEKFCADTVAALARLIEADAARLDAAPAETAYGEYLNALAPLASQLTDPRSETALNNALDSLAGKSSSLAGQLAIYRQATSELLRWRERSARAMADAQQSSFPPVESEFFQATVSRADYTGLFPMKNADPDRATLMASAPDVLIPAIPRLSNKMVTARDVTRLPGESRFSIARYQRRTYVNSSAPLDLQKETEALRASLLIGDQQPPLTLASKMAVYTAERGDLAALGGEIIGAHLESLYSRFAALPAAASVIVPLDRLPREKLHNVGVDQVLMRFDLQPQWAQHRYFFTRLQAPPNSQAAR